MKVKKSRLYLLALLPFLLVVFLFELIPIVTVVARSFMPENAIGFTFENYMNIFTKDLYRSAIFNSLIIAITSSMIGLFVAFFGAKAAHHNNGRAKKFFMSILNMCSNFSGVPLAFAYIILLGNVGVLTMVGKQFGIDAIADFQLYTIGGLLLVYIYFQIPLATLLMIPSFDGLRPEWKEVVSLLGGSNIRYWIKVAVPVLFPSILGTFSVLFANALAAYATAYALVMNNVSLLPIRISEQFMGDIVARKEFGSALAVIMMFLMVVAIFIQNHILKKNKGERL